MVFPVGGLGTRFLPATKSMPKEMLPVVDKPLIHYAFEEAQAAGIEQFIFVTGRNKHAIEDHFDHVYELQSRLSTRNKDRELDLTSRWLPEAGNVSFTRQQQPLGLGHAVWCARHLIGDEPFAVILADDLIYGKIPCMKQMVEAYQQTGGNILGVVDIPRQLTASYGILDIEKNNTNKSANKSANNSANKAVSSRLVKAKGLVEKPLPAAAPSTLSIVGRYILQPEIFKFLENQPPGAGGEIQLTDAIASMTDSSGVYGYRFEGTRYDCGNVAGYVAANVALALERNEFRHDLSRQLAVVMKNQENKK